MLLIQSCLVFCLLFCHQSNHNVMVAVSNFLTDIIISNATVEVLKTQFI